MVKMAIVLTAITLFYGIVLTVAFNFEKLKRGFKDRISKSRSVIKTQFSDLDQLIPKLGNRRGNDSHGQLTA